MKAEELMVGDWVKMEDVELSDTSFIGPVVKIKGTKDSLVFVTGSNDTLVDVDLKHILPITITKGILKKNGAITYDAFARIDIGHYYVLYDYDGFVTICNDVDNVRKISYLSCDYVHQLQHALKLCGINKEIVL